ncbi:hypothetical protein OG500_16800 [Kitasatospora sp. NBC_01250]|uniref:hypothetical protein n=1 Tax=unclassified Kitasatospora TaxID=2633591 RepID=UPI002E16216B|nr:MULTISPECIES: hypothetical protein [unclassified Kitasatospora]WSJ67821.1 hypothetical protein OG294_17810 [Kitasatospora sp. NBC_01302]
MSLTTTSGALAALGAALLLAPAAAGTAMADSAVPQAPVPKAQLQPTEVGPALGAVGYVTGPVKDLRLDPFAQSSADPLNNAVAVKPDNPGMRPVSSTAVTGALSDGGGAKDLPGLGLLLGAVPGH